MSMYSIIGHCMGNTCTCTLYMYVHVYCTCMYMYMYMHVHMYMYLITHKCGDGTTNFVVAVSVALWTQHDEQKPCGNGNLTGRNPHVHTCTCTCIGAKIKKTCRYHSNIVYVYTCIYYYVYIIHTYNVLYMKHDQHDFPLTHFHTNRQCSRNITTLYTHDFLQFCTCI